MLDFFRNLDRRWIFLLMGLSVAVPILLQWQFPETPSALSQAVFDEVEALNEGDRVLFAFDFDPGSEGELGPMATSWVRHCCEKKLKMYFMSLWPVGQQMIDRGDAFVDIGHEDDYIGVSHRHIGLLLDLLPHLSLGVRLQTSGVHQYEPVVLPIGFGDQPVPGGPGNLGDYGLAVAYDAVEQGRLTHVGPADDGHDWNAVLGTAGMGCRPRRAGAVLVGPSGGWLLSF